MSDDFFGLDLPLVTDDDDTLPSGWLYLSGDGLVKCVFSATRAVRMGQGANRRTHKSRNFWFIEQVGRDRFEARMLTDRDLPSDDVEYLRLQGVIADFTPELAYYEERVVPALLKREESLTGGRRGKPGLSRADNKRARTLDQRNVKGLFGLALIFLERGETDRAGTVLSELAGVRADFEGKNQFLFNEFGIALRKNRLYAEAVDYFRRALDFAAEDDHLYYNLARAHYENGDWSAALDNLILSHRLNPGLQVARGLFEVMVGLENNPAMQERYDKPEVPAHVAARAREILASDSGKLRLDEEPVKVGIDIEPGRARSGSAVGVVELKKHGSDE